MTRPFEATLKGPPREFVLDQEVYEITGSWSVLTTTLLEAGWAVATLTALLQAEDREALVDRVMDPDDQFGIPDVERIAAQLVKRACGVDWWVAGKLLGWAEAHWSELDGWALTRGLDLLPLLNAAPARVCSLVYYRLTDGADATARARFDGELSIPPPSALASASTDEDDADAFMAALAQHRRS